MLDSKNSQKIATAIFGKLFLVGGSIMKYNAIVLNQTNGKMTVADVYNLIVSMTIIQEAI